MIIKNYSTILFHAPVHGFASYETLTRKKKGMVIGSARHKCQGLCYTKLTYTSYSQALLTRYRYKQILWHVNKNNFHNNTNVNNNNKLTNSLDTNNKIIIKEK